MKLSVLTVPLNQRTPEEAFRYLSSLGVQAVEIGTGGYPGSAHLNPEEFLADPAKIDAYKELLKKYQLSICAFSVHGNPVHPNKEIANKAHTEFINTCKIAEKFGVKTVITFSGCPGDSEKSVNPNWVTCAWPPEYLDVLKYQWEEVLIPYWKSAAEEATKYGVTQIALEMHPGFCVYNPGTLLKLREAVGPAIGANFDPSHLYWQGIKPSEAIKSLKGAIHHFHAKDTKLDTANIQVNGVLDSTSYADILNRAWSFRTVGYGHDLAEWKETISTLRVVGYDGPVSIEHEDPLMSIEEGLEKAIRFMKEVVIFEEAAEMWWA